MDFLLRGVRENARCDWENDKCKLVEKPRNSVFLFGPVFVVHETCLGLEPAGLIVLRRYDKDERIRVMVFCFIAGGVFSRNQTDLCRGDRSTEGN